MLSNTFALNIKFFNNRLALNRQSGPLGCVPYPNLRVKRFFYLCGLYLVFLWCFGVGMVLMSFGLVGLGVNGGAVSAGLGVWGMLFFYGEFVGPGFGVVGGTSEFVAGGGFGG